MALRELTTEWKHVKSYATEANLRKALEKAEGEGYTDITDRYMIVKTTDNRWTAIVILDKLKGGYVGRYEGFIKV